MDLKTQKINNLISDYMKISKAKGFFNIPASTDPKNKNYKYFEEIINEWGDNPSFDTHGFLIANFQRVDPKPLFPAQLKTKIAWNAFLNYRTVLSTKTEKNGNIIKAFENSKEVIIQKIGEYNCHKIFREKSPNSNMSLGMLLFFKNIISPYFCVTNKYFIEELKVLDDDLRQMIDLEDLTTKRKFIKTLPNEIKEKLINITGSELWI